MVASVSNTVYGIINDAMVDAGKLAVGKQPNSTQLADYMRRLCDVINLWQTEGLKLFLSQEIAFNLVTGQSLYTVGTGLNVDMSKPLQVLQGYILGTNNIRRPLTSLSWDDWMRLSQVTGNNSQVNSYFVDKQATKFNIRFWPPPDATEAANTAYLLMRTQALNPVNLEENISFPQEWRIALRWALADDICTGQPTATMDRCQQKAEYYKELLQGFDVEDAPTRFEPDSRISQGTGNFR